MIEEQAGGAIELGAGFLVRGHGGNERGLGEAVADGDAELELRAFVGLGDVDELVESASVADRGYTPGGRPTEQGPIRTTKVGGILRAPKAKAAIVCEQIERRKQ